MGKSFYQTYLHLKDNLKEPLEPHNLDGKTLGRLYESKLIYLEELRIECFRQMNFCQGSGFDAADYEHILQAKKLTKEHLSSCLRWSLVLALVKKG